MNGLKTKNDIRGKVITVMFSNFEEMEKLEEKLKKEFNQDVLLLEKRNCKISVIKIILEQDEEKILILEDADDIEYSLLKKIARDKQATIII